MVPEPLLLAGGASRLGGGAKRLTALVACVSFSYSTDVLRGTFVTEAREPDAHELLAMVADEDVEGCCMRSSAARTNAFAMLTVVSLTVHRSGLFGARF